MEYSANLIRALGSYASLVSLDHNHLQQPQHRPGLCLGGAEANTKMIGSPYADLVLLPLALWLMPLTYPFIPQAVAALLELYILVAFLRKGAIIGLLWRLRNAPFLLPLTVPRQPQLLTILQ